nr:helix-turn-helix transcriptional regulator [Sphingomonas astaxanthinifaciens]
MASNLRAFRAARGISQEDLAASAGIHRNYLGGVERCERNIAIDNLEKLAAAMGMDIAKLLTERAVGSYGDEGSQPRSDDR